MLSIELMIVGQLVVIFIIIIFILVFLKKLKADVQNDVSGEIAEQVVNIMEPLIKEADSVAMIFENQIKEKQNLIKKLNEKLDNRIISLNLFLDKAETYINKGVRTQGVNQQQFTAGDTMDQQAAIFELYNDGVRPERIAEKLSIAEREVDLVIDLKKKLIEMERNGNDF